MVSDKSHLIILFLIDFQCDADTLYKWKQWADCFVLVYSVDDIDSLREIVRIKRLMDQVVNCNLKPTFIIANKIDLSTAITVSTTAGIEYANEAGCPHYELSARENFIGIEATFTIIIETAIRCSMLSQINKFYQSPSSKDPAVTQKERKSSFKSIVKTLTRQKAIKEEIKEENGNEQKEIPYVKGYDLLSNSSRRRSSTCTFWEICKYSPFSWDVSKCSENASHSRYL